MRKSSGKIFYLMSALAILYLLVLWTEWLPLSTPAGKKAVAIIGAPMPAMADAENAFSQFWFFSYDIPEADKAKVMAADIEKYSLGGEGSSTALGNYPFFEDKENLLCKPKEDDCLKKLRANQDKYRELFAKNAKLVDKAIALTNFKASRSPFRPNIATPLADFPAPVRWQLTTAAYWHVQGKQSEAIDFACRAASSWRGMAENSHGLIDQMIGLSYYASTTRLLSEIISETPMELALPASCADAYRTFESKKFPICPSIQLEYRMFLSNFGNVPTSDTTGPQKGNGLASSLWYNKRATQEELALGMIKTCSDDPEILEEIAKPNAGIWNGLSLSEIAFNPVGGTLVEMAISDYSDYARRMQNIELIQHAMQAVFNDRKSKQSAATATAAVSDNKNLRVNLEAKTIEVDLYKSKTKNETLVLRLTE